MCVMVWFVCLGKLKHYVSHTHMHTHRQKHADTLYSLCHVYTRTRAHTHTHTLSTSGESDVSCEQPAQREKNVWTNLRRTRAYAYRHTTEHFQPTMLTLYCFPEPFYLHAGQVKQRFPVEHHREAGLGGFGGPV